MTDLVAADLKITNEINFIAACKKDAQSYDAHVREIVFAKLHEAEKQALVKAACVDRMRYVFRIVAVIDELHCAGGLFDLETEPKLS